MSAEKCLLQFCLQSSYEKLFPFLVANVLLQIIEIVLIWWVLIFIISVDYRGFILQCTL